MLRFRSEMERKRNVERRHERHARVTGLETLQRLYLEGKREYIVNIIVYLGSGQRRDKGSRGSTREISRSVGRENSNYK